MACGRTTGKKSRGAVMTPPVVAHTTPSDLANFPASTTDSEVGDASDPTLAILQELEQEDLCKEAAEVERKLGELAEEGEEEELAESSEEEDGRGG